MSNRLRSDRGNFLNPVKVGGAALLLAIAGCLSACRPGETQEPPTPQTTSSDTRARLSDSQVKLIINYFGQLKGFWADQGVKGTNNPKLCFMDGNPNTPAKYKCPVEWNLQDLAYNCPSSDKSTPNSTVRNTDATRYCDSTDTIVITYGSMKDWNKVLGDETDASLFVTGHEYGHAVEKLKGTTLSPKISIELGATCFDGFALEKLYPAQRQAISTVLKRRAAAETGVPNPQYGTTRQMLDAFNHGAQTGDCDLDQFTA